LGSLRSLNARMSRFASTDCREGERGLGRLSK